MRERGELRVFVLNKLNFKNESFYYYYREAEKNMKFNIRQNHISIPATPNISGVTPGK